MQVATRGPILEIRGISCNGNVLLVNMKNIIVEDGIQIFFSSTRSRILFKSRRPNGVKSNFIIIDKEIVTSSGLTPKQAAEEILLTMTKAFLQAKGIDLRSHFHITDSTLAEEAEDVKSE